MAAIAAMPVQIGTPGGGGEGEMPPPPSSATLGQLGIPWKERLIRAPSPRGSLGRSLALFSSA